MPSALKVVTALALAASLALATPAAETPATTPAGGKWAVARLFAPKSEVPAASDLLQCVNTVATKLGIDKITQTDTALLQDILKNDMHLDAMPRVMTVLADELATSKPLAPMYDQVRKGVTAKEHHPVIGTVLCAALEDPKTKVAFENVNPDIIKRTVHHMFLLDKLVKALGDDNAFMEEMQKYLRTTTDKLGGTTSTLARGIAMFKAAGWFGLSKDVTMNIGINSYIELRKQDNITWLQQQQRAINLSVNIREATGTDLAHGYLANAKVGHNLAGQLAQGVYFEGEKKWIRYKLSDDWARHYQTWNLAFITGNLHYLNLLYPKLLTPRVLLANGPSYMFERLIALWLSLNFYLMADLQGKTHLDFAGREDLAKLWGEINVKYVDFLAAQDKK